MSLCSSHLLRTSFFFYSKGVPFLAHLGSVLSFAPTPMLHSLMTALVLESCQSRFRTRTKSIEPGGKLLFRSCMCVFVRALVHRLGWEGKHVSRQACNYSSWNGCVGKSTGIVHKMVEELAAPHNRDGGGGGRHEKH